MEWLVLLSCIIFIEFVKNSRNLLVYFDFTSFVLRFEKNLQKPEGTAHLPQATASSMFGKSAGIPLELPSDKVMCHACHVCHVWHQNVTCIAASGTSYVFMSCHLPLSKVSLGFLMVYRLFSLSRYLKSLQNNCRIVVRWTQICGWSIISEGLQIWPRFRYPWTAPETRQIWNIGLLDLLGLCLPKARNSLEISESFMVFGKFRNPKLNNLVEVISGQCWKSVNQEFLSNIYFTRKPLWTSSAVAEKNTQETYSFVTLMALAKTRCVRWQHDHHKTAQHWHSIGRTSHLSSISSQVTIEGWCHQSLHE